MSLVLQLLNDYLCELSRAWLPVLNPRRTPRIRYSSSDFYGLSKS